MVLDRQKKTLIVLVLLIIIIFALVQLASVMFASPKVLEEKVFPAKGEIGTKTGIAIDSTTANFGRLPPFSSSQKRILIGNSYDKTVTVITQVSGDIAPLVEVRPLNAQLKPGETLEIRAQFNSKNYSIGNYTGHIRVLLLS